MTDNRRDFLLKSASIAAALSVGGINAISKPLNQIAPVNSEMISVAKDAGMQMSNAYFSGMEANKQLIELAKQMGAFGAIAGIDMRLTKSANANPWDYNAIMEVRESWKKVGLNYNTVEGPPSLGEKTKLGLEGRDEEIANFITFMKNLKRSGVDVICYNWMPVISWARTQMDRPSRGGALVTAFDYEEIKNRPLTKYGVISPESMWKNLEYFLKAVVPEAEKSEKNYDE